MLNKMKLCRSSSSSTSESKHWIKLPKSFSMRQSSVHQARPEAILPIKCSDLERHQRIKSIAGGTVYYKVVHKPTGSLYSLKVIHGHHEEPVRRQIVREFQALRNVDNPNIVKCYGMFEHKGTIQVLLEYTDGGCLKDKYVPNEKTLAALARQVLAGLACLHGKHVVHRDIKPSNLLINYLNQVKIADYVGSNVAQTMDPCNSTVGNVAYMCPERIDVDPNRGKVVDPCAGDIWSFGISILELYMGRYPFPVDRYEQGQWACLTMAICMSQPPQAPPTASREFRHFIRCCLQKEPSKRWPAAQLLQHPFISGNGGGMTYS